MGLVLVVILSACNIGQPSLDFPTPSPEPTQTFFPTLEASPTVQAAGPTGTQPAGDPFTANFLTPPAPDCTVLTPGQTEGPYYKTGSPERQVLVEAETEGEKLLVAGYVVDQDCQPIPGTQLDFWQADGSGVYDNEGFGLRGHQFTDDQGRYFLETVFPGQYTGRTEHIHVKIQPPGAAAITSQLYFPNSNANTADGIFDPALVVTLEEREGLYVAYFNFVLQH
jgi:protocatechuate 3,4-dioxygenase beta subunit